ncbi:hypothetical protein Srot_1025 [Segniliparus rotundus DSM 44985]|uniref:Lipoprotein n=2 Tax=Segniliparus rotundus TaxID=286802 RepID=D6ZEX4_SEGRD|nr:hypothetical protein Srot_1025 [Segniliparus rotundus DSM 44985]
MKRNFFAAAVVTIFVAGLGACQRSAPATLTAHAEPAASSNEIGAFTGDWEGHGGGVVIDESGHGVRTIHNGASDPGTKTTFTITGVRRMGDGIVADYSADSGSGKLTFFCTSDGGNLNRGDLLMDSWPLHAETAGSGQANDDSVIQAKRDKYCIAQRS